MASFGSSAGATLAVFSAMKAQLSDPSVQMQADVGWSGGYDFTVGTSVAVDPALGGDKVRDVGKVEVKTPVKHYIRVSRRASGPALRCPGGETCCHHRRWPRRPHPTHCWGKDGLVLVIVGGVVLGQFLPAGLRQYLPGTALQAAVTVNHSLGLLRPGAAVAVLGVYAAIVLAAVSMRTAHRDA